VGKALFILLVLGVGGSLGVWVASRVYVDPLNRPSDWAVRRRKNVLVAIAAVWLVSAATLAVLFAVA
jgi:uncharacterized protein (DUF3084 family)